MQPQLLDPAAFTAYLRSEGLVIVALADMELIHSARLNKMRMAYLAKTALTFKQIIDAELLPVKSKQGIESWIERGQIKPGEVMKSTNGTRKILVSALKRLGQY